LPCKCCLKLSHVSRHCKQIARTKCMYFSISAVRLETSQGELSTSDDISIISRACLCWSGFVLLGIPDPCSRCMFGRLSWFDLMAGVSCTLESTRVGAFGCDCDAMPRWWWWRPFIFIYYAHNFADIVVHVPVTSSPSAIFHVRIDAAFMVLKY